ncbi:MAG: hypothetical protein HYV63_11280 [Candidatus Schekmanbacteria bacterium]|nr:hypothetical protein [Candidatus Schekmanbacteria bacterium]
MATLACRATSPLTETGLPIDTALHKLHPYNLVPGMRHHVTSPTFQLLLAALLAGCYPVLSRHPLPPPPAATTPETRLPGDWYARVAEDEEWFAHVDPPAVASGPMRALLITLAKGKGTDLAALEVTPTSISGTGFLTLRFTDSPGTEESDGYFFAVYSFSGSDALDVRLMDANAVAADVQGGKIAGTVSTAFATEVRLTSPGTDIAGYVWDAWRRGVFSKTLAFSRRTEARS